RNFVPSHQWIRDGGWNIADCVQRSYDVEGMDVGVIAAGRIGRAVLERMKPFGVNLHYFDVHRLSPEYEKQLGVTYHPDVHALHVVGPLHTVGDVPAAVADPLVRRDEVA
uniref:NAD(P)-dependent oxidoreductase n=1 Tax=Mycobacterium avium TaxID=1764 RepID=UPI0026DB0178